MAVVPSTELPSCVTGSPAILRGGFNVCMQIIFSDALEYNYNACWHLFIYLFFFQLLVFSLSPFRSFAYIEFSDRDSVTSAIGLHETLFRGRVLKVRSIILHVGLVSYLKLSVKSHGSHTHTGYYSVNNIKSTVWTFSMKCPLRYCYDLVLYK